MHSNHLGTLTVSSKLLSSNKTLTVRIWSQQFVYISKRGIDEQEVRQYFADMLCTYINVYTYKQYMLKRLGTIAGYEHISCSRIVQGTLLQDSYSDLVQAQLDSLLETRALSRLRVRFSSMQQQTQHIICVSIADHSRRWLLPSYGTCGVSSWLCNHGQELQIEFYTTKTRTRVSDRVLLFYLLIIHVGIDRQIEFYFEACQCSYGTKLALSKRSCH